MTTTVRNVRDGTYDPNNPDHVYIGRANRGYGLPQSKWANPRPMRGEADREACVVFYAHEHLPNSGELLAALPELAGKVLYCWCAPKLCHGHILAATVNYYHRKQTCGNPHR